MLKHSANISLAGLASKSYPSVAISSEGWDTWHHGTVCIHAKLLGN